jgi:hypothetical protein
MLWSGRRGVTSLEIKVTVSAIVSRFELEPAHPELAPPVRSGIVLAPRGGGRVRVAALPAPRRATAPSASLSA